MQSEHHEPRKSAGCPVTLAANLAQVLMPFPFMGIAAYSYFAALSAAQLTPIPVLPMTMGDARPPS